jgi:hypothetical protein
MPTEDGQYAKEGATKLFLHALLEELEYFESEQSLPHIPRDT